MNLSATASPTNGRYRAELPPALTAGERARWSCAFLVIGFGTLLSGCGESAVVTEQVRLHKAPATQSEVVVLIPKGSSVDASSCTDGWCRIKWNGKEGYALAKTLRPRSSRSAPAGQDRDEMEDGGEDTDTSAD